MDINLNKINLLLQQRFSNYNLLFKRTVFYKTYFYHPLLISNLPNIFTTIIIQRAFVL